MCLGERPWNFNFNKWFCSGWCTNCTGTSTRLPTSTPWTFTWSWDIKPVDWQQRVGSPHQQRGHHQEACDKCRNSAPSQTHWNNLYFNKILGFGGGSGMIYKHIKVWEAMFSWKSASITVVLNQWSASKSPKVLWKITPVPLQTHWPFSDTGSGNSFLKEIQRWLWYTPLVKTKCSLGLVWQLRSFGMTEITPDHSQISVLLCSVTA